METKTIRQGLHFLDTNYPKWFESIDLEMLDLHNTKTCIAGQMATHFFEIPPRQGVSQFSTGLRRMGMNLHDSTAVRYGMNDAYHMGMTWTELTDRWKVAIKRRLAKENT